jgi:hypothetical protein
MAIAPKKSAAKSTKKPVAPAKKPAAKKSAAKKSAAKKSAARPAARRDDFGKPVDGMIAKQPEPIREILVALRKLVVGAAPDATAVLKWGMPFYSIGAGMMCALGAHKAHVNLILSGPEGTYDDPEGLLEGEGKSGRHLKVRSAKEIPVKHVRGWLAAAAAHARSATGMR